MSEESSNEPIVLLYPQRSEQWRKDRRGIPTASHFDDIVSGRTWGWNTQTAHTYMCRLVAESILDRDFDPDLKDNTSVQYGVAREDEARDDYVQKFHRPIEQVGLVLRQDRKIACSPDGFFNDRRGILEIKCPEPWTHVSNSIVQGLASGKGDEGVAYMPQLQGQLMICQAEVLHFWSWRHDLPPRLHVIPPNDRLISILREMIDEFCDRLDRAKAKMRERQNE